MRDEGGDYFVSGEPYRPLQPWNGPRKLPLLFICQAQEQMRERVVWSGFEHFERLLDGLVISAREIKENCHATIGPRRRGVELQGSVCLGNGFIRSSCGGQEMCKFKMRKLIARAQLDGPPVFFLRGGPVPVV